MIQAVIFDLFGTLVDAPSRDERADAVAKLAHATVQSEETIGTYLDATWTVRHAGTLPTVRHLAEHLIARTDSRASTDDVAATWRALAPTRVDPDQSVIDTLEGVRDAGVRIGLISDASAEIAEAWPYGRLAEVVDHAIFSCTSGAIKPSSRLYREGLTRLDVDPAETLYVGDGGGDELRGARAVGLTPVRVARRGGAGTLAYGVGGAWEGLALASVEALGTLPFVLSDPRWPFGR